MTSHAQRRRAKLAKQLEIPKRTSANIIRARTAEHRAKKEGEVGPLPAPSPREYSIRHWYLKEHTKHPVQVLIVTQTVAYFSMPGGPRYRDQREFSWLSTWAEQLYPAWDRATWAWDDAKWHREWEPSEDDLHDLAQRAIDKMPAGFKHLMVIHAPGKLAFVASDGPLPRNEPVFTKMFPSTLAAVPDQPIVEGAAPHWWPDGAKRRRKQVSEASRPAKGEIYALSQIAEAVDQLFEARPQTRVFTTQVGSLKAVDARVDVSEQVALIPLVDVQLIEDAPGRWDFVGDVAFIVGELYDGPNLLDGKAFETKEGRDRFARAVEASLHPRLGSVLEHLSIRSGTQRGENLIATVSLTLIDERDDAFFHLVDALQEADHAVSTQRSKSSIEHARAALAQVQHAAETPRQVKIADRALRYEERWKRFEETVVRMVGLARGVPVSLR